MLGKADSHLDRAIYRALRDAKWAGRTHRAQNCLAARTARWIRPDLTPAEAEA